MVRFLTYAMKYRMSHSQSSNPPHGSARNVYRELSVAVKTAEHLNERHECKMALVRRVHSK
jgi:hypothetical protein